MDDILINRFAEDLVTESGYSRLMRLMTGLVPRVRTFAIMTWENPMAKNPTELPKHVSGSSRKALNRARNDELRSRLTNAQHSKNLQSSLVSSAYGFFQIKGKYGELENPYFIMNISRDAAIELGREGWQESIIFGTVDRPFDVTYEMVFLFGKEPSLFRRVWTTKTGDMHSEYKGRKFTIPFDDESQASSRFSGGSIVSGNLFHSENYSVGDRKLIEAKIAERNVPNADGVYTEKSAWTTRLIVNDILRTRR